MWKIPTQLLYGKDGIIVPRNISCACMLPIRHDNAIQCTVTDPRKYSYDLLQGALYIPIYDTPNSLFTELMVDHDTLLGKELGLACLE